MRVYSAAVQSGPEDISLAISRLRAGRLVAFPTETVYGLGADAFDAAAVERVFIAKGRPSTNPLIVHVCDIDMARSVAAAWPPEAEALARAFWPGPLTLVLPRSGRVPAIVTAGGTTVAVRMPRHPLTLALIAALGSPLVGPSANRSGRVSPTDAAHVRASFDDQEVFVLDGGPCEGGIESTVADLTTAPIEVLRPGLITPGQIAAVLGGHVHSGPSAAADHAVPVKQRHTPARSPGVEGAHYQPAAPTVLAPSADVSAASAGHRTVALTWSGVKLPEGAARIGMPASADAYAARLYAALREADAQSPTRIVVEAPPQALPGREGEVWGAVADRLRRAAQPWRP